MPAHPHDVAPVHSLPLFDLADAAAVRQLAEKDTRLGKKVKEALDVVDDALSQYGEQLHLSFNGGKDCTVLVHLLAACLLLPAAAPSSAQKDTSSSSTEPSSSSLPSCSDATASNGHHLIHPTPSLSKRQSLPSVYVQCQSPFPQVEEFVDRCTHIYNLSLSRINAPMKLALERYKQDQDKQIAAATTASSTKARRVDAVLVGTRIGDPYSETLSHFTPTDSDWPPMMRVHPILQWTYDDVWEFLRSRELSLNGIEGGIEWCNLYDYGYTSLGSTYNTIPNPELKDDTLPSGWKPAWELKNADLERAGRPQATPQPEKAVLQGEAT